jgi:hypothetical protein
MRAGGSQAELVEMRESPAPTIRRRYRPNRLRLKEAVTLRLMDTEKISFEYKEYEGNAKI